MRAMSSEVLVPTEHAGHSEKGIGQKAGILDEGIGHRAKGIRRILRLPLLCALCPLLYALCPVVCPVSAASGGTIRGTIKFTGPEPGNRVIRMGMDPMCAAVNRGKQIVNEIYQVGDNNALGSVFVKVEGTFPATPMPATPVEIDQTACIYRPRVVGA